MLTRSRRLFQWWSRALLLLMVVGLLAGPVACRGTKPRNHWWQFWRPKTTTTYDPSGGVVLPPPPPDVLDGQGTSIGQGELPAPPKPIDGTTMTDATPIRQPPTASELQTVYFDYDSAELSPQAQSQLDANAQWLLAHPGSQIQIGGHCDERGSVEYNLNLGDRRAKTVKAYLVSRGVSADTLHTISYGEEQPLDPGQTEAAYAQNRRAQFLAY